MKSKTREAVSLISFIANLLFFLGMIISLILIFLGIFTLASEDESFSVMILKASAPTMILVGIISAIWHALLYALLNGFAVLVENSDRTQVERALFAIANSVSNNQPNVAYYQTNDHESEDSQERKLMQDIPQESDSTNDEE